MSKNIAVTIEWMGALPYTQPHAAYPRTKYLALHRADRLYEDLGVVAPFRVRAQRFNPTRRLHQIVAPHVDGLAGARSKTPYHRARLTNDFEGDIKSVAGELFEGGILVSRIRGTVAIPFARDSTAVLSTLLQLRSAKEVAGVARLIRSTAGAVQGRPRRPDTSLPFSQYFAMQIQIPLPPDELTEWVNVHRSELAALLVGAENANLLRPDLVNRVWESSEELNVKAAGEAILLNRQGILYVRPTGRYQGPHLDRFDRTRDLATLALFAREFLRSAVVPQDIDADSVARRIRQWVDHPETTFDASFTQTLSWQSLSTALNLSGGLSARDAFVKS